jgi:glycosyltransferase involved in cell wall biosynthesis
MNVLFLSEQIYPHSSGAEVATYLFAKLLSDADFNVKLITNKFSDEPYFSKDGHLSIYRIPLYQKTGTVKFQVMAKFNILFSSFLNKMMDWADVVYVPRFWFTAIPLAKAHKKPVITHLHDYVPICPYTTLFNSFTALPCQNGNRLVCSPKCAYCYEKSITKRPFKEMLVSVALNSVSGQFFSGQIALSDAIICVSNAQKNIISKNHFLASNKLSVVYNPFFDSASLPVKGRDFGYFGGLDRAKGFQTLYKAAHALKESKNFAIHSTKFSNYRKDCELQLKKSGFIPYGTLEKSAYNQLYTQIQTVIIPSIWFETWSYVIVEALLNGRYVIASKIGGMPEVVETCKGVSLFEPGNSDQLKAAMNNVLSKDVETMRELGFQNRESFLRRFSNETTLKKFVQVIDRIT